MKGIRIRFAVVCKLLALAILLTSCAHASKTTTKQTIKPKQKPRPVLQVDMTAIIDASKRSYLTDRSYLADKDAGHFLVAGRYVWIFYDDYMIVKSASAEVRIPFKCYKPPGECIQPATSRGPNRGMAGDVLYKVIRTDCVPRTIYSKRNPNDWDQKRKGYIWNLNRSLGFWVFNDRVVVTLGDMQYYYKYDGTFIERKKNEKDWDLKTGPYAKYKWRMDREHGKMPNAYFKDLRFDSVSTRFSGPWVAIRQKSTSGKNQQDYLLIDRATGEVQARYLAKQVYLRAYANGFYIDKRKPNGGPGTPLFWYGETIVDVRDDDPQKYCYAFKGKKKCVLTPKMNPKKECYPSKRGCVLKEQNVNIYGMIETDDFILKVPGRKVPGRIEITFDKENYYTKTHHFTAETYKHHLRRYTVYRRILKRVKRNIQKLKWRQKWRKKKQISK